jgi:hypothetical protein
MRIEYSWEDLRPIHPLWYTVLAAQAIGALANLLMQGATEWFDVIWQGAAVATFFGFIAGLVVQSFLRPGSLSENRPMVAFVGVLAFVFSLLGLFLPFDGGAA